MAGSQSLDCVQQLDTQSHVQSQQPLRRYHLTNNRLSAGCNGQPQQQHQQRSDYDPVAPIKELLTPTGAYIPPQSRPPYSSRTLCLSTSLQTEVEDRDLSRSIEQCHPYENKARTQHAIHCKLPHPTILPISSLSLTTEPLQKGRFDSIPMSGYTTSPEPSSASFQRPMNFKQGSAMQLPVQTKPDFVADGCRRRRSAWSSSSTDSAQHIHQKQ